MTSIVDRVFDSPKEGILPETRSWSNLAACPGSGQDFESKSEKYGRIRVFEFLTA
jgi:hypothetical protein